MELHSRWFLLILVDIGDISRSQDNQTQTTTVAPPIISEFDLNVCTCDVTGKSCDVNCCCDSECSLDDRAVFSGCTNEPDRFADKSCVGKDFIIFNHTTFHTEVHFIDGLLCLVRDNNQPRLLYSVPAVAEAESEFTLLKQAWADDYYVQAPIMPSEQQSIRLESYKVGDTVLATNANGQLVAFALPSAIFSDACSSLTSIKVFDRINRTCMNTVENLQQQCTQLGVNPYLRNVRLVRDPFMLKALSESQAIPSVFTIEISAVGQVLQPTFAADACQNVPTKIHYRILFNASLGISEATVNFLYDNLTRSYYRMQFSVDFGWTSDNQVLYRSGNPGYKDFAPIMAGQSIQVDEKQAVRLASDRFEWFTIPEGTGQGLCTSTRPRSVLFRENLVAGCHFEMTAATGQNECIQLQNRINALLLGPDRSLIAAYANASVENPGDWVPLLIASQLQNTTTSPAPGTCSSMILGANFEFLFAYTGSVHNPQAKIIGAQKSYLPPTDVRFQCIGPYCQPGFETLTQKIPVVLTVTFVDVSSTAQPINARIPTFDARLPYDFFYPFTVGDSAVSLSSFTYFFLSFVAILILVFDE